MKKILIYIILLSSPMLYAQSNSSEILGTEKRERVFKNELIKKQGVIYLPDYDLFRAEVYDLNEAGTQLAVYDFAANNLFSIKLSVGENPTVIEVSEIGNGRGSGPGEFRNPTDICLAKGETGEIIVVADPQLGRISIWGKQPGSLIKSFRPNKIVPFRLSCTNDKIIMYNSNTSKKGSFIAYNFSGEQLSYIKESGEYKEESSFMKDGYLATTENSLIFSSMSRDALEKFDLVNYKAVYQEQGIKATDQEQTIITEKDDDVITTKRAKGFIFKARGVGIWEDYILVLYSGRTDAHGNTIDFYNLNDLSYQFSFKIDEVATSMKVSDDKLLLKTYDYSRKEHVLSMYQINKKSLSNFKAAN